ncbi:DJ-1 family glyoxalase III [Carboxylicivirga sp. N1Y90]|uniref:DJ-1 family glyoxalase III n=1 Tax=Carboxylicivirga fragile TaxID=3417571 RepID=UPI003D348C89|nr:DJ-1/PfpI family protein [Marinilabiliaceae bacterium N1Y90]
MNHVAIFLADGFEEIEALTPVDVLRRANIKVSTISISDKLEVEGSHNIKVVADKFFEDVDYTNVTCLVLPGGLPGAEKLQKHKALNQLLINFAKEGKLIGAICAAPMILGTLGITDNKNTTCYPGFEKHLGKSNHSDELTIKDTNLLTGKAAGASMRFSLQLVEMLTDKATANELADKMFVEGLK